MTQPTDQDELAALIDRIWAVWNEHGPHAAKVNWAEDFEYHDAPDFPDAGVVRGRDNVADHLAELESFVGGMRIDAQEMHLAGEYIVLLAHVTVKGATSGAEFPGELAQVFTMEDSKLKTFRIFLTWAAGLEFAGIDAERRAAGRMYA